MQGMPPWVTTGKARIGHMFSGLALDSRHQRNHRSKAVAERIGMRAAGRKRAFGLELDLYLATQPGRAAPVTN
jgi:hypothetical protein